MRLILTYFTIIVLLSACQTVEIRAPKPNLVDTHPKTPTGLSLTALVIGNTQYQHAPLANPINDATDIAEKLSLSGSNRQL